MESEIYSFSNQKLNPDLCKIITKYAIFKPHPFIKQLFQTTKQIRFICNNLKGYIRDVNGVKYKLAYYNSKEIPWMIFTDYYSIVG